MIVTQLAGLRGRSTRGTEVAIEIRHRGGLKRIEGGERSKDKGMQKSQINGSGQGMIVTGGQERSHQDPGDQEHQDDRRNLSIHHQGGDLQYQEFHRKGHMEFQNQKFHRKGHMEYQNQRHLRGQGQVQQARHCSWRRIQRQVQVQEHICYQRRSIRRTIRIHHQ